MILSFFLLTRLVVFRHDLLAASTCPGEVLTKTEACQSEDWSFSGLSCQQCIYDLTLISLRTDNSPNLYNLWDTFSIEPSALSRRFAPNSSTANLLKAF